MQNEIGNFKGALKTLEDLKLFSLDSMNTSDTINAMKNEGYGKVSCFPLNSLLCEDSEDTDRKNELASKFCKKNGDQDRFQRFENKVAMYSFISRICWKKHEIMMNIAELSSNLDWGYLALQIIQDISLHLRLLMNSSSGEVQITYFLTNPKMDKSFLSDPWPWPANAYI